MLALGPLLVSAPVAITGVIIGIGVGAVMGAAVVFALGRSEPVDEVTEVEPIPAVRGPADPRVVRALHSLPLGVLITDATGAPLFWNRFASQFRDARHSDALVEVAIYDLISDIVGSTRPTTADAGERQMNLYGPPERHLLLRASPTIGDGDELTGCIVVIEDETATQQAQRVRIDFVANVSHELRTPVGAIGVLAETLVGADVDTDADIVSRLAGRLQREALRLGDIIDDLLVLSRLDAEEGADHRPVDLTSVARCVVERSDDAANQAGLVVLGPPPNALPAFVLGDDSQLSSAIGNLLDNAIKYTDEDGEIEVSVTATGDRVELVVRDSGVGIPDADLDRIFERFYRVDSARSRATGGTGLGLSIVRHVVLNHGGTIEVRSAEGQGSSFTIDLPLHPEESFVEAELEAGSAPAVIEEENPVRG